MKRVVQGKEESFWQRDLLKMPLMKTLGYLLGIFGVIFYFSYTPEEGFQFTWTPYILLAIFGLLISFKKFIIDKFLFRK